MAPFEDTAADNQMSDSELDKLCEVTMAAEILSITFDDTAVTIGIRMGEATLWLGGDDVSIATAIPGVSCSSSELSSVYSTRL